jgi:hypothetical protein
VLLASEEINWSSHIKEITGVPKWVPNLMKLALNRDVKWQGLGVEDCNRFFIEEGELVAADFNEKCL